MTDTRRDALAEAMGGAEPLEPPTFRGKLSRLWDQTAPSIVAVLGMIALLGIGAAWKLASEGKDLSQQNLNSQNNHHASSVKKDAQLQQALNTANAALAEVKEEAAAIEYEGNVIAYQNGEIIAAQQSGHATLTAVAALQTEINADVPALKAGLTAGQAQINTYLHFLTCLGTNPTDPSVCGTAPPLPPT